MYQNKKIIAIIPARAGSKGLKDKNFINLCEKPLISYSIEFAIANTPIIDKIVVISNSQKVLDISSDFKKVKIVEEPENLAEDDSKLLPVLNYVLEKQQEEGENYDYVVLLQPTNPFRPNDILKQSLKIIENDKDSVITIVKDYKKHGKIEDNNFIPQYQSGITRQQLPEIYNENGCFYLLKPEILKSGQIFGSKIGAIELKDDFFAIDIDTINDLFLAESYLKINRL